MNKIFKHQIGRNMEAFVDDMLIKSIEQTDHMKDLQEDFNVLKRYQLKLYPKNVSLGIVQGNFWDLW